MTPRPWAVLAALALALAAGPEAPAAPPSVVRKGPHYRVLCHFDDERCADAALETAEAVWPVACDLLGLAAGPLDVPLDLHLYRDAASYAAADREIAGGKFDQNLAFSSWDTLSGHVALQPDLPDEALAACGLTAQTRHNVAHEAAHLACFRASAAFRSHPAWFSEGSAVWMEQEAMVAHGWSRGPDDDPYVATDAVRTARLLAGGHLPDVPDVLRGEPKGLGLYERYGVQSLLFRRLATRRDGAAFRAAVRTALAIPEGPEHAERFRAAILAPYAVEGPAELSLDFEHFVRSRRPAWDEVARSLSTAGADWLHVAFAERDAVAWRTAPAGAAPYEIRGEFEILPGLGAAQRMDVLVGGGRDAGHVAVGFSAGTGVTVTRVLVAAGATETLASVPLKTIQPRRRMPFRIAVEGAKVTVRLDGLEVVAADAGDLALEGPWGLGVAAGASGFWRNVRIEARAK